MTDGERGNETFITVLRWEEAQWAFVYIESYFNVEFWSQDTYCLPP